MTYHSHSAKQRVLRVPLAAIRVGTPESGISEVYLFQGVDYHQFLHLLNAFHLKQSCEKLAMTKTQLKSVLSLAQGHRERELIRYTTVAAAGLSASGARKHYGFNGFNKRVELVENALQEAEAIHAAFESVAHVQEAATLSLFGIESTRESDSSSSEDDTADIDKLPQPESHTGVVFSREEILSLLISGSWNWYELVQWLRRVVLN